jgi:RimJ/RimL family protein N-acetyltransferase
VPIRTARLELVTLPLRAMQLLNRGARAEAGELLGATFPRDFLVEPELWMEYRIKQLSEDPSLEEWLMRGMLTRAREMIGNCGFHNRPDASGMVEVGYSVAPDYRRQGYAEESVRALIEFAFAHPEVARVRASVSPANGPSLGLVRKLGFARVGVQYDEVDGEEIVFELARAATLPTPVRTDG